MQTMNMPPLPLPFVLRSPPVSYLLRHVKRFSHHKNKVTQYLGTSEVNAGGGGGTARRTGTSPGGAGSGNVPTITSSSITGSSLRRKSSVKGIIRRTCSIQIEPGDMPGRMCFLIVCL